MNGLTEALKYFLKMQNGRTWATIDASRDDCIIIDVGSINFNTGAHERRTITRIYYPDGTYVEHAHA